MNYKRTASITAETTNNPRRNKFPLVPEPTKNQLKIKLKEKKKRKAWKKNLEDGGETN